MLHFCFSNIVISRIPFLTENRLLTLCPAFCFKGDKKEGSDDAEESSMEDDSDENDCLSLGNTTDTLNRVIYVLLIVYLGSMACSILVAWLSYDLTLPYTAFLCSAVIKM